METIEKGDKLIPEIDSTGNVVFKKMPADYQGPYYVAIAPGDNKESMIAQYWLTVKENAIGFRENLENPIQVRLAALDIEVGCHKMISAIKERGEKDR